LELTEVIIVAAIVAAESRVCVGSDQRDAVKSDLNDQTDDADPLTLPRALLSAQES